ncbi:MAG TPA: hotdog domain-containing protein [Longimicrobiaceae bacterium]|nr:hotdog domain-containing protein [Longimicrobiaceae bacterium]
MRRAAGGPHRRHAAGRHHPGAAGDVFGGRLVWRMDLAAGIAATRRARGCCATGAVEGMAFLQPVQVGDEVNLYAKQWPPDGPRCPSRTRHGDAVATWRTRPG